MQRTDFEKLLFANKYIELLKKQISDMHIMLTAKKRDINPNLINDVITKLNREIKDLKKNNERKNKKISDLENKLRKFEEYKPFIDRLKNEGVFN